MNWPYRFQRIHVPVLPCDQSVRSSQSNHWNRRTANWIWTEEKTKKVTILKSFPHMWITEWRKIWSVSEKCCSFDSVKCLWASSRWLSFLHINVLIYNLSIFLFFFFHSVPRFSLSMSFDTLKLLMNAMAACVCLANVSVWLFVWATVHWFYSVNCSGNNALAPLTWI